MLRRKVSCPGASDKHEPRFLEDCGKRRRAIVKGGGGVVGAGKVREKGDVRDEEGNKGMARAGGDGKQTSEISVLMRARCRF